MACGSTVFAKASNWGNYFYNNYFNSAIWTARGPLLERDWVCHHRLCAGGCCWLFHSVVASTHSLLQDVRCSGILHFWLCFCCFSKSLWGLSRKQLWVISGLKCFKPIFFPNITIEFIDHFQTLDHEIASMVILYTSCAHVLSILIIWTLKIILCLQISTNL